MFGYVAADPQELTEAAKKRYSSVYCGICRVIGQECGGLCRLGLSYDAAFLALLLMSLYEPENTAGSRACGFHPFKPRGWIDNEYIRYSARMNVALAYYKALDDRQDGGNLTGRIGQGIFEKQAKRIMADYPRQCGAIEESLKEIRELERANCPDPDQPAGAFGRLLGELLTYREDLWQQDLYQTGDALGRFIYLADAAADYAEDKKKNRYNPFLAMGTGENPALWKQYLAMTMGRCTESYEKLPLVQDKDILDNILYSGVWTRRKKG